MGLVDIWQTFSIPFLITSLLLACCLEEVSTMAVDAAVSTLLVAAVVATVVKAFLRNENEVTDDFFLSKGISKSWCQANNCNVMYKHFFQKVL